MNTLRFNGSLWCNLDIALRHLDQVYGQVTEPLGLAVLEWYVLRALYEQDGQRASDLAHTIGRPPTSFTPMLDKLEQKKLIVRRPDPRDRRVVRIHLTRKGKALQEQVRRSAREIDSQFQFLVSSDDWEAFQRVLVRLQSIAVD